MDKKLWISGLLVLSISSNALAISDGSGWKIVAQLTSLLQTANAQLQKAKDMLDVEKKLEEMETVKAIKETSNLADDLNALFDEMDKTIDHFDYDPESSISDVRGEIDDLMSRYEQVKGSEDKLEMLRGYANLLKSIENLSFLKSYHMDQMKKMAKEGLNEQDAVKQTAYTNSIATQLLIERNLKAQEKELRQTKHTTEEVLYMKRMGDVYGARANKYQSTEGNN